MITENEALALLEESGLADAARWAAPVAFARTAQDFDDDAGHDQSIIGGHNYVYIRDLMDRCTGNGRFARALEASGSGDDYLSRGIPQTAFAKMPSINPGSITRNDYHQSPGWASAHVRVLIQSYKLGQVDKIRWVRPAKKQVATQAFLSAVPLFDDEDFGLQSLPGIPDDDDFVGTTLVLAHASSPLSGQFELFVGQSKQPQYRGDTCWHWRLRLLASGGTPLELDKSSNPDLPGSAPTGSAEDIGVRIRRDRALGTIGGGDE